MLQIGRAMLTASWDAQCCMPTLAAPEWQAMLMKQAQAAGAMCL